MSMVLVANDSEVLDGTYMPPDHHLLFVYCPEGFTDFTDFTGRFGNTSHYQACQRLRKAHTEHCDCGINPDRLEFQID